MERLPDTPDGALKSILSLTLLRFVYFYSLLRGLILHCSKPIFASFLSKDNRNLFVRHNIRRRVEFRPMPTLYDIAFATADDCSKDSLSYDTDDIPFVIDNSVNAIICSQCRLFKGPLIHTSATLEISEGLTAVTKLVGTMKLLLNDDANKHHSYIIPRCLFDPNIPVNILVVPALGTLFGDNADGTDPVAEDDTTIKSGSTKSNLF